MHASGEWRTQLQNDDRARFDEAVSEVVKTSEREGGWMRGAEWRIAEYELREVAITVFMPNVSSGRCDEQRNSQACLVHRDDAKE